MIKLNLGAGRDHRLGWINADVDSRTNPDVVVDLEHHLPFISNSISQILLQDVLEHFTKESAESLLRESHRVLKNNGTLELRVPNVWQIFHQFRRDPAVMLEFLYGTTSFNQHWGAHRYGYTPQTITKTLKRIGFDNIVVHAETTNWVVSAKKNLHQPILKPIIIQQAPMWGGSEEWMESIATCLSTHHVKFLAITNLPKLQQAFTDSGGQVIHLPFLLDIIGNLRGLIKSTLLLPYAIFWYTPKLIMAKNQGYNLVVMSGFTEKLLVTWLCHFINLPTVWLEYGSLEPVFGHNFYLPKIIYRATKHLPQKVVTISQYTYQNLLRFARVSQSKIALIPPGVVIPNSQPKTTSLIVGHLSRLSSEKNQSLLIRAWPLVIRHHPSARLKIAGTGPYLSYLKQLAVQLKVTNSVKFLGFVTDKSTFYQSLSLFVFTSNWPMEGFGLVVAEAMAHSLPVIAINHGPLPEIIDSNSGILVNSPTPKSLSAAINTLLSKPKLTRQLGTNARKTAIARYNLKAQTQKVYQVFMEVIAENS